ncbi:MAG: DUF1844 domain-containing protein [Planctomycetes bacterium]|nr:DUF1844 domain-containing protein [Planctomycetota bacterium]
MNPEKSANQGGSGERPRIIVPGEDPRGGQAEAAAAQAGPAQEPQEKKADESWKEKARREKEKLAEMEAQAAMREQLPPASFLGIIEDIALRAMLSLGQMRDPATGEVYIDLEGARYTIDLLAVLEQKTRGNLEPNEERALKDLIQNLRLVFVQVARALSSAAGPAGAGGGPRPGAGPAPGGAAGPGPEKPAPKIII